MGGGCLCSHHDESRRDRSRRLCSARRNFSRQFHPQSANQVIFSNFIFTMADAHTQIAYSDSFDVRESLAGGVSQRGRTTIASREGSNCFDVVN